MDTLYLKNVTQEAVAKAWSDKPGRLEGHLQVATHARWVELSLVHEGLYTAIDLSRTLECEIFGYGAQSSVDYIGVYQVHSGEVVRRLEYTGMTGGWCLIEGEPQPWEAKAFQARPVLGQRDLALELSDGSEILEALALPKRWQGECRLHAGPLVRGDKMIIGLLFGVPLLLLLLLYFWLVASDAPGGYQPF